MYQNFVNSIPSIKEFYQQFINCLPNRCLLCHQHINSHQSGVCCTCLHSFIYSEPICLGCGKKLYTLTDYCGACLTQQPIKVIAPASYHSEISTLITGMKYHHQFASVNTLVTVLISRIKQLIDKKLIVKPQVIVPVPLHTQKLKERGFNQAFIIAKEIAKLMNLPIETTLLTRHLDTQSQAGLDGKQRRQNVTNAFTLNEHFPYQRIALIDDVVTTGATVNEVNKLFAKRYIHTQVWCLARAEAPSLID